MSIPIYSVTIKFGYQEYTTKKGVKVLRQKIKSHGSVFTTTTQTEKEDIQNNDTIIGRCYIKLSKSRQQGIIIIEDIQLGKIVGHK